MDYTLEFDWIYGKDYHNESITNDTMKKEENQTPEQRWLFSITPFDTY